MSRQDRFRWFSTIPTRQHQQRLTKSACRTHGRGFTRRLHIEPLEDRRMLAVVTVDTNLDTVDFNDGVTSLREAIFATNLVAGADTIRFDMTLSGGTILLTMGELAITDSVDIQGLGANRLTIDASGNDPTPERFRGDGSRIFNIDDGLSNVSIDVIIDGLTLTRGDSRENGGAIFSVENLTVNNSVISGNRAGTFNSNLNSV